MSSEGDSCCSAWRCLCSFICVHFQNLLPGMDSGKVGSATALTVLGGEDLSTPLPPQKVGVSRSPMRGGWGDLAHVCAA